MPLPIPAIKMGGLEKTPVMGKRQLRSWPICLGHPQQPVPDVFPPVEAQPVALEDAGELGSRVFQATQEIILAEGADLGGALRQS